MPAELDLLVRARYPLIWLSTAEEDRAVRALCETARALGDEVQGWSLTYGLHDLPGPAREGRRMDITTALAHIRKQERRAIWVLFDVGALCAEGGGGAEVVRALRDTLRVVKRLGGVLVCIGHGFPVPSSLAGEAAAHTMSLALRQEHEALLRGITDQLALRPANDVIRALATACLGLTLDQAENIWARVQATGGVFTAADLPQVLAEKARIVRSTGYLEIVNAVRPDSVGGLVHLKRWIADRRLAFEDRARDVGLPYPRGLLLVGVQGCGKSLTAKAVAGAWDQPLLRLDVGALMGGFVGLSENNLRRALEVAERVAPCVLWVDEIEKGFAGLRSNADAGVVSRMFGALLTWMQERTAPVFVLATANQIDALPPELMRKGRFDETFFVDLPDATQRAEIWGIHLGERARLGRDPRLLDRIDLRQLIAASEGYSGAEIAAAVTEGAFAALTRAARRTATAEPSEECPALPGRREPTTGAFLATEHMLEALRASTPLSQLRAEEIDQLRAWARDRARVAG